MRSLQYDPSQWREPHRFIPDRYNPKSEWYLRPDGETRATYAWAPFYGGHRMCLGMRLAELALKTQLPLYYHFFDFEFVEQAHMDKRPVVELHCAKVIEIPLKFKTRNEVPAEFRDIPNQ